MIEKRRRFDDEKCCYVGQVEESKCGGVTLLDFIQSTVHSRTYRTIVLSNVTVTCISTESIWESGTNKRDTAYDYALKAKAPRSSQLLTLHLLFICLLKC